MQFTSKLFFPQVKKAVAYFGAALLATGTLTACQSTGNNTPNMSIEDLVNRKSISDADRQKIVSAAHKRVEKELANNQPKAAIHFAKIAAQFDGDAPDTQILLGRSYLADHEYSTARQIFSRVNASTSSAKTLELQGQSEYFSGDLISARKSLENALNLDFTLWEAASILGRITRHDGEIERSNLLFNQAFESTNSPAKVHNHSGFAALSSKEWLAASQSFEQAQRLSGGLIGMHTAYRVSKAKVGDMVTALSLASDEETALLYRELAKISLEEGERISAIKYLQKSKTISPKHNEETERLLAAAKAMKN